MKARKVKQKDDLFHGNVIEPGGLIFVFVMLIVLLMATILFCLYSFMNDDQFEAYEVTFASEAKENDDIVLTAVDGRIYKIRTVPDSLDMGSLQKVCGGITPVSILGKEIHSKEAGEFISVDSITVGESVILNYDDVKAIEIKTLAQVILIFIILQIILVVCFIMTVKVGRHPGRYSKKVVHLFIKPGYIIDYNKK